MVVDILENIAKTKNMVKVHLFISMDLNTKEAGSTMSEKDMGFTTMKTATDTKESGKSINDMARAVTFIQILVASILACGAKEK